MKHLLEYIFEASTEYDKLMSYIHSPESEYDIKQFIADKGMYKVLNILGRNGAPMRNASIEWVQRWKTTAKRKTEYARGEFGRTPQNFMNNLNYIFHDILGLEKSDYTIEEPQLNRTVSSNSKLSSKITVDFAINGKRYVEEFYICDTQLSALGKEILISDKKLLPTAIITPNRRYTDKENLLKDIETNLKESFKSVSEGNSYAELLLDMIKSILNDNKNKGTYGIESLINLTEKKSFEYILNDIDKDLFKSLDNTSKNNIAVVFGEILAGIVLINLTDDFDVLEWPGNNERINDLYFNNIGISVKRKNSSIGHLPEVQSIANIIIKSMDDLGIDPENISSSKLNDIKNTLKLDRLTQNDLVQFRKDITAFYNLDNSKKSREDVLWDVCWEVLKDDPEFKELLSKLKISKRSDCKEEYVLKYMSSIDDKYRNSIIDFCINMSGIKNGDKIDKTWIMNPTTAKERENNYSKIMRGLQLKVCSELNNRYTSENETSDLFSVFVSNALRSMQSYIDITDKDDVVLKFSIENMQNGKYIFKPAGSTWNEWKAHGNIGFKIK